MPQITTQELLDAGVHFGHLRKKWNPKMLPYIFMEKKGIHIIDLNKTQQCLEASGAALKSVARAGRKILFVATKKQAKEMVKEAALEIGMPFVVERWLGGMLTNFATIRKSIKKMQSIDRMLQDGTLENVTKKERLVLTREKQKMERVLGGIAALNRLPAAVVMVDIAHEHIALKESKKLNITTFGLVDTNSDPTQVDFPIPANDDATKSIAVIMEYLKACIKEGLGEREKMKAEAELARKDEEPVTAADFDEAAEAGDAKDDMATEGKEDAGEQAAEATKETAEDAATEEATAEAKPKETKPKKSAPTKKAPAAEKKAGGKKALTLKKSK